MLPAIPRRTPDLWFRCRSTSFFQIYFFRLMLFQSTCIIFLVNFVWCRSNGVVLSDMVFFECQSSDGAPIVLISGCASRKREPIRMLRTEFKANSNGNGTSVVRMSSGCQLTVENSSFIENTGVNGSVVSIAHGAQVVVTHLYLKAMQPRCRVV